jgi:hypothetical protein
VLDQLCSNNEAMPLNEPCDFVLDEAPPLSSLIDEASSEVLNAIYREMDNEDESWHNQEYALAEVDKRLRLRIKDSNL